MKKIIVDNVDLDQYQDEALGKKFERVLEDTGVFIMDTAAREGFNRFIAYEIINKNRQKAGSSEFLNYLLLLYRLF